jgi:hypothetical protein
MCGSTVARAIMKGQQSDRLWLAPKESFSNYLQALAGHAIRSLEDFPPKTEVIVNGARHIRREDGAIPFIVSYAGVIGPVVEIDRIPVRIPVPWVEEPQGQDAHVIRMGAMLSAGMLGQQKLRMYMDFRRKGDDDGWAINTPSGRGHQEAMDG